MDVADSAVFLIADEEYGESIDAAFKLEPGPSLAEADVRVHGSAHGSAHWPTTRCPRLPACTTSGRARTRARCSSASVAPYGEKAGFTI